MEKYYAPHIKEQPEAISFYGYGWVTQKTPRGTKLIWHNGGNGYFGADFRRYINEKTVAVLAANTLIQPVHEGYFKLLQTIFADPKSEK